MRYSDIPSFTSEGNYQVDVPLNRIKAHLDTFLEMGLNMEPDFQRAHVWTETQQIRFVEWLLRGGKGSAQNIYFNHTRWDTLASDGEFVLVDGLQRTTAVLRFLNNEIPVFGGYYFRDFEGPCPMHIGLRFCVNNLKTRAEVLQWYLDINAGGVAHTEEEIEKVRRLLEEELKKAN